MSDNGLLKKAAELRAENPDLGISDKLSSSEGLGISPEDQQEIMAQINKISQSNKMKSSPSTWKVVPKKKGFVLPLLVNLGAAAVLAIGFFSLSQLFGSVDVQGLDETVQLSTAEGRLVAEIRREAEGAILEKDREINEIQARLAAIEQERQQITASFDQQLQAREAQLRAELEQELEAERQRLRAQGLSEEAIQERLRAFEEEKNRAFQAELSRFTAQIEAERRQIQANLDAARNEFNSNLAAATAERQRIQEESRQREIELRAQMDAQSRELEAARAQAAANLQSAQMELRTLNEAATRAQAAEDRLIGLYSSIRAAIREGRIEDAERGLSSLRTFIADPSVATLPGLSRRRDIDLFAMDLIDRTLASERARTSPETARLSESLAILSSIRETTQQARTLVTAGNRAEAANLYRQVLQTLPEVLEAQQFTQDRTLAERQALASTAATAMNAAYSAQDWNALDQAFGQLLAGLPLTDPQIALVLRQLREGSITQDQQARIARETQDAQPGLNTAQTAFNQGRFADAIRGYATLLDQFPNATQVPQIVQGLEQATQAFSQEFTAFRNQAQANEAQASAAAQAAAQTRQSNEATIQNQQAQIQQLQTELTQIRQNLQTTEARLQEQQALAQRTEEARQTALREIQALQARLDSQATQPQATPSTNQPSGTDSGISQEEFAALQQQAEAFASVAQRYERIVAEYQAYVAREDQILAQGGSVALIQGRNTLASFLNTPAIANAMPTMQTRIDRYFQAAGEIGSTEVLFNAADILDGASRIQDLQARQRYFAELRVRYQTSEGMLEFLRVLESTLN